MGRQTAEYKAWLRSEPNWKNRVGKDWRGVRVLGQGGYGITGHYQYVDTNLSVRVRDLCVKQTATNEFGSFGVGGGGGAVQEGDILNHFKGTCPHIIQILHGPFTDTGSGVELDNDIDELDALVERIYLELMEGGDLCSAIEKAKKTKYTWKEEELWSIFYCLTKAVLAMHSGSEDPEKKRWDRAEVCHFDIKLENVLVGKKDQTEHSDWPICKIADFGLTEFVPTHGRKMKDYVANHQMVGDKRVVPPEINRESEEKGRPAPKRRKLGTESNIWQIGYVMYFILADYTTEDFKAEKETPFTMAWSNRLKTGLTYGQKLRFDVGLRKYSQMLRELILECLMHEPTQRPPIEEVVRRCGRALTAARSKPLSYHNKYPEETMTEEEYAEGFELVSSDQPEAQTGQEAQASVGGRLLKNVLKRFFEE